jgi:hypothetical protein
MGPSWPQVDTTTLASRTAGEERRADGGVRSQARGMKRKGGRRRSPAPLLDKARGKKQPGAGAPHDPHTGRATPRITTSNTNKQQQQQQQQQQQRRWGRPTVGVHAGLGVVVEGHQGPVGDDAPDAAAADGVVTHDEVLHRGGVEQLHVGRLQDLWCN